eukprot:6235591-Prymnesium_polylepis.1
MHDVTPASGVDTYSGAGCVLYGMVVSSTVGSVGEKNRNVSRFAPSGLEGGGGAEGGDEGGGEGLGKGRQMSSSPQ